MASRARAPRALRLVTLASDLGSAYAAQVKAVLLALAPGLHLVDLTHELRAHAVGEAAFVLRPAIQRFPSGAVHLVVVDPGVGGARRPVAVACRDGSILVGPDNGVLAPLAAARGGGAAYRIDPNRLGAPPRVGTTFDGRDVFAPATARLAGGAVPADLGPRTELTPLAGAAPVRLADGARGKVAHIDRFGNVVTDIPSDWPPAGVGWVLVHLGRRAWRLPRHISYEAAGRARLFMLGSSFGTLELAVAEGRAADRLSATVGTPVRLHWEVARPRSTRRNRK